MKAIELARSIDEYPQTINAITKEKRGINPKLSIKLGNYFNIEKEYFMLLQASFEVKNTIQQSTDNPLKDKIRKAIFWDTDLEKIDWQKNRKSIIQRILERGNKKEINDLIELYTIPIIKQELEKIKNSHHPSYDQNINKYILKNMA